MLTLEERSFLRSCIFNGFEFKQQHEALNDRPKEIMVDGEPMTIDRFMDITQDVEKTLDQKDSGMHFYEKL